MGFKVVDHLRYLSIRMVYCSAEQAFAPAIAKMKARAEFLKTLALEDTEKATLFKMWVQPVVWLTARAYPRTKGVLASSIWCIVRRRGCTIGP